MKITKLSACLAFIIGPIALIASPAIDRQIEDAAKASYNYRTVLDDNVKVKSNDGVVTLTGTVQDKDERTLAADTAENIPGVVRVDNQIKIESTVPERSDAWMALKIRGRLLVKANVSATDTKVAVNDGNVVLSGTAENAAQKELTAAYAADIAGVKSVKNNLIVAEKAPKADAGIYSRTDSSKTDAEKSAKADTEMASKTTIGEKIDDASITAQVKYALLSHKSTSALKTKVNTKDGVVTVSGDAKNDAEKSLVTKLAKDVRGTTSVKNDMKVLN